VVDKKASDTNSLKPGEIDPSDGGTRVDLGEDLLERTAMWIPPRDAGEQVKDPAPSVSSSDPITQDEVEDQLQSARILIGEGIIEEAKRILRKLLLADQRNIKVRQMLAQVHELELKQILGDQEPPRRRLGQRESDLAEVFRADDVMRDLDRDLQLGLLSETGFDAPASQPSLFKDREAMDAFGAKMDQEFSASPVSERIDVGVAFLEMGLHDLAIRHFQAAVRKISQEPVLESLSGLLSATGLLGYALILGGRAFEATIAMQTVLSDSEIPVADKLDLTYLMGRAFEALQRPELALPWYRQAAIVDPHYRDVEERLGKISAKK
jgi:tetratricopeptide (TPR) repeat protein